MGPNVLLIVLDAARADHFEPYGASAGSTPVIADMARDGAFVPRAYTTACWTIPAHTALFSGLLPRVAGLPRAPGGTPAGCRPRLEALRSRLLAEVLHRHGYETRGLTTNAWLIPESGFNTGFDRYELIEPERNMAVADPGRRASVLSAWEGYRAAADDGARAAGDTLRAWVDEPRDKPFFWFVNLVEAHSPYLPPRPYNELGAVSRARAALEARRYLTLGATWQACVGALTVPEGALTRMRTLYRNSVRLLDDWVGRILESLDAAGILDETLVIVTADHGESLGEAGALGHAFSLDEHLVRVPFVSRGPGAIGNRLLSLASVPARVAEAVGLEGHPWHDRAGLDEIAIAHFDPPGGTDDPRVRETAESWGLDADGVALMTKPFEAATDGEFKLIRRAGGSRILELGDGSQSPVSRDPSEPGLSEVVQRLTAALDGAENMKPVAPGAEAPSPDALHEDDASVQDLERRMRLLGYM